jgi:hypothetical protein
MKHRCELLAGAVAVSDTSVHAAAGCTHIGYLRLDVRFRSGQAGVEVSGGVALTAAAHRGLVWLNSGVRLAGHRDEEWLQRGVTGSR